MPHFTELIDQLPISQHIVSRALDIVCKNQGEGTEDERRTEWLPLFYSPDPLGGHQRPYFSYGGEDMDKTRENNLQAFTKEQWERLARRAQELRHPWLSARYFDLLWQERRRHRFPRPYEFARSAMAKYENSARERFGNLDLFWDALHACQHLGCMAAELNDASGILLAARLSGELLDSVRPAWETGRSPGLPLRAAEAVEHLVHSIPKAKRSPELINEVKQMLKRLCKFMPEGSAIQNTYVGRDVLERMRGLERLLGIDSHRARELQQAESRVAEARARAADSNVMAGSIMMEAAEQFTALGESERAAAAKKEARTYFEQGTAEMKPYIATTRIPAAPLEAWVNRVAALGSPGASLVAAVSGNDLFPNWQATSRSSSEQAERYPFQSMIAAVTLVDGRPVKQGSGRHEMRRRNWLVQIQFGVHMLWNPLVEKLKLQGLTPQSFVDQLVQAGVVAGHNTQALTRAVEAALTGEYVVACHMLPSIIESALRHVCAAAGIDMNAYRPKSGGQFQERTMGPLFDDDPISELVQSTIKFFGEDLWNWYRTVLFDEKSLNLRNRAAHGLLRDEECGADTAQTLLLALAALLRLRDQPQVSQEEPKAEPSERRG